jgi:hypothetical protein
MRAIASAEPWPQFYARIGGVLYLLIIAAGLFAEAFVRNRLVVPGDAAATASNITRHAFLFRLGIAADVLSKWQGITVFTPQS